MRADRRERGAAVVEFALVVPVLLILVLGIVEFGRAYQVQTTLSAAAREGARSMALGDDPAAARETTKSAFPLLNLTDGQIAVAPSSCSQGQAVTVTITRPYSFITGFFGSGLAMTGVGSMRCGG